MAERQAKGKKSDRSKKRGAGRGLSLTFILWAGFSFYALIIIFVYGAVQNMLVNKRYREQTVNELRSAGSAVTQALENNSVWREDELSGFLLELSNRHGVHAFVLGADGREVLPRSPVDFTQVVTEIREKLRESEGNDIVYQPSEDKYAYASVVTIGDNECYVYVSHSLKPISDLAGDLRLRTLITGLLAVVLAFAVSGFVALVITKPVTEVTEKAKELARGNYSIKFNENYYCTEICELSDALDYASEEISKSDRMQKELIANVSHDFKTPLTMIKAYASMIREISGDDPEKRNLHTQVIIDESDRLTALVNDMLDISKLRAGIGELRESVFNLSQYLYGVTEKFKYLSDTQGYTFVTEIEEGLYTRADKEKIGQVLYNLIGNAVNYTGEDKHVFVRLAQADKRIRFEVRDTGKGIPQEELADIWERYYRSSELHKRPVKGTGLGLSIVKTALDRHKFQFGVQSEEGKGSCFWVEFPAAAEDFEEEEA
ncbi:MAG: HAMP domain-containing histidine kinase [Clostridia bacterium]|jgi:signal transduction histidine kinase|nr:HAMP domain-containing histidine kinase [Clostridia bacterium]